MTEIHLPTRAPHNRAMAATLQQLHAKTHFAGSDMHLLQQLANGLRRLDTHGPCHYSDPIRGYSHAHHVMAIHAGHRCDRYQVAADYAMEARP